MDKQCQAWYRYYINNVGTMLRRPKEQGSHRTSGEGFRVLGTESATFARMHTEGKPPWAYGREGSAVQVTLEIDVAFKLSYKY